MSEKITKSWIEKTIHEKAKKKFEDDVEILCRGLNQKPFLNINLS